MSQFDEIAPVLIARINSNIEALGSAMDEIRIWIKQQGSIETALSIRSYLAVLEENNEAINAHMAELAGRAKDGGNNKQDGKG